MKRPMVFISRMTVVSLCLAVLTPGCTTRSKARAETAQAFRAGQQRGAMEVEARRNNISFTGPVLNPIVPWTEGLTLAQAILAAHWSGQGSPRLIVFTRDGDQVEIPTADLLNGMDFPLAPGDAVELRP
jgi:hypothetical protein